MKILEGVKKDGANYVFDYTSDNFSDVVHLTGPYLYKSSFGGNDYYFGYEFNPEISSKDRSDFIKFLKGTSDNNISDKDFQQFVDRPLADLDKYVGLANVETVIYPVSNINNVVRKIVRAVLNFMQHSTDYITYELVKNIPKDVTFDYKSFATDRGGVNSQSYKDSIPVINKLLDNIHKSEYFSIARDVKTKYRPFIMNYLKLSDEYSSESLSSLINANSILVIDDINTSGSTLREILRIVRSLNNTANVYIYTLIGKA